MNDSYKYDFGAMSAAHDDLTSAVRFFDQANAEMADLAESLHQSWPSGYAADAYHAVHTEQQAVAVDLARQLDEIRKTLGGCIETASGAEQANTRLWDV